MPLGMYAQSKHALRLAGQVASVDADCVIKADCLVADIKHADCLISRARWRASTPTTTLFSCSATPTSSATASALTISVHALALPQRVMVALRQRPELIDATSHARLYSYTARACVFTPQRARARTGRILTADARVNAFVFFIAGGKEAVRLAQVRTPAATCGGAASQRRTCGPPFTPRGPAPRPAHPHRPAQLCLEFVRCFKRRRFSLPGLGSAFLVRLSGSACVRLSVALAVLHGRRAAGAATRAPGVAHSVKHVAAAAPGVAAAHHRAAKVAGRACSAPLSLDRALDRNAGARFALVSFLFLPEMRPSTVSRRWAAWLLQADCRWAATGGRAARLLHRDWVLMRALVCPSYSQCTTVV